MSVEKLLKTAAYFEDRANRSRRPEDKDRFLAVAKKYPVRAEAVRKREADLVDANGSQWAMDRRGVRICSEPRTPAQVKTLLYHVGAFPPDQPRRGSPAQGCLPPSPLVAGHR
jgi:hypothetical protein